jgi:hypothetical protein
VTVDTETSAEIQAKSDAAPKPKSQPERIRESLRQALSPKKPSDAVKADSPDRAPRPVRSTHRISGSGSPRAEPGAAGTKGSTAQEKPRRPQRAGNSDAA